MKATNFSYFLPRHIYNSIETQEVYPPQIRPSDPELTIDKAMTMLNIAEDQIIALQKAEPFSPASFGFVEEQVGGENEFDLQQIYTSPWNRYWITREPKAMTWNIKKLRSQDGEARYTMMGDLDIEWSITAFIPNKLTGAILLQSLGIIEIVNPEGVYSIPVVEPQPEPQIDKSQPIIVFAPRQFTDPKELDALLLEHGVIDAEGVQLRQAMFFVPEALNAMRQVRFLIQERNDGRASFEKVETAINEHPNFSPEQKEKMLAEWNNPVTVGEEPAIDTDEAINPEGNDQNPAAEAPVTEVTPTE